MTFLKLTNRTNTGSPDKQQHSPICKIIQSTKSPGPYKVCSFVEKVSFSEEGEGEGEEEGRGEEWVVERREEGRGGDGTGEGREGEGRGERGERWDREGMEGKGREGTLKMFNVWFPFFFS